MKRTFFGPNPDPPESLWQSSDMTQQALMEKGIGFNCLNYNAQPEGAREYHYLRNKTFLDAQCTDGIRTELMFPSCWNGQDLDSTNHSTHVAYPSGVNTGTCPDGYPKRLPTLFYETIYQTNLYAGVDGEFVLANGDPTGYGYHGDFMCAWDAGVLQSAIDNPHCNMPVQTTGNQEDCPVFKLQHIDDGTICKMETPEALRDERIDMVQQLPGNVQIQAGPGFATMPGQRASPPFANTTATSTPAAPTPGPSASISTSLPVTTQSPCNQQTITTTYMSEGVLVNMVLIEEIVFVTISANSTPTSDVHRKRHMHKHGH